MLKGLLLFIFSLNSYSQIALEEEDIFKTKPKNSTERKQQQVKIQELLELEIEEHLVEEDFLDIDRLAKLERDRYYKKFDDKEYETNETPFLRTTPYKAILKKNSIIHERGTKKFFRISKNIVVTAKPRHSRTKMVLIISKSGKKQYLTQVMNLHPIEEDLNTHVLAPKFQTYENKTNINTFDKVFHFEHFFSIHEQFMNLNYFDQMFGQEDSYTYSGRYEYKLFYQWHFPAFFGVNLNYEHGTTRFTNTSDYLDWSSFYYGPQVRFNLYQDWTFMVKGEVGLQRSYAFELKDTAVYDFSANVLQLGIEADLVTEFGTFISNITFRYYEISLDRTDKWRETLSTRGDSWAIGISIGYGGDFEI